MTSSLKPVILKTAKALGLFALSRRLLRGKLRILCYHGFTLKDEELFVPGLFISPDEFARRMDYLARAGYSVLPLDEAFKRLKADTLPPDPVVLTIDDGFYSVYSAAKPVLERHHFPATLYLTSYYFQKGTPIFSLAVDYMFWSTDRTSADLSSLGVPGLPEGEIDLTDTALRTRVAGIISEYGQGLDGNDKRTALARALGETLGVSYDEIAASRILSLIDPEELVVLRASGVEIELHTHRHDFPAGSAAAAEAISRNRDIVEPHLPGAMRHFCYPSGVWSRDHWSTLSSAGVETATTCETGFVERDTPAFALPRILDSARVSQIEFEAEVSGFLELKRRLLGALRGHARGRPTAPGATADASSPMIG